jgi:hypothetical protein
MAVQLTRAMSGFARYAWTVFAGLGGLLILGPIWPAIFDPPSLNRQYNVDLILIQVCWVLLAVYPLRRAERWAWYAMALWPLWLIADAWFGGCGRAICGGS